MNTADHGLEQAFLKLPKLKHVGMALLQFIYHIQRTRNVQKDAGGIFRLGYVAFSFPEGDERIRLHVDVDIKRIDLRDRRWLSLHAERGVQVCEIKHAGQLACAARYIENANSKYLCTRQTTSHDPAAN